MIAAAIILAGGASRRMGSPKALLTYQGQTFVDRLASLFEPVCEEVFVVLGHEPERIRSGCRSDLRFVVNERWQEGQLTSLQAGLRSLSARAEAVFYTPVDYPCIDPEIPAKLLEALSSSSTFAVPRYDGKHGHPILFRASVIAEFLNLGNDQSARDVVHAHVASTAYVDVPHAGVLTDVDLPSDYEALLRVPL